MTLELLPDPPAAPVIQLEPGKQSTVRSNRGCRHRGSFEICAEHRTVTCEACGAPLDPFELLLSYAQRERNWRNYQSEVRDAEKRLAELKDEERKVKARTKAASRKEAAAAVDAERVRTERERVLISDLARDIAGLARRIDGIATRAPRANGARR